MIDRLSTDFPDPDSPTMPSVRPRSRVSDTPSTACTTPPGVRNPVRRSATSSSRPWARRLSGSRQGGLGRGAGRTVGRVRRHSTPSARRSGRHVAQVVEGQHREEDGGEGIPTAQPWGQGRTARARSCCPRRTSVTPTPSSARLPSATMATAMPSSAIDIMAGATLGSTSRSMIRRWLAPSTWAALTNSRSDQDSALARGDAPEDGNGHDGQRR